MNKRLTYLKVFFLCSILLFITFSGCIEKEQKPHVEGLLTPELQLDHPSILPDWNDGDYHDYYDTSEMLNDFNDRFPDLVDVFSIGKSVLGKDIWCIRITNENNYEVKSSCLIDGCIHGNEWEAGEACLYLTEYLLINFDNNATITQILNTSTIYIVPLLNPDGRRSNERWNDNGVDLNRNFDVFFGRLRGRCFRLGKLFGRIKIPIIKIPFLDPYRGWYLNCGRRAFSEPESQAIRDLMKEIAYNDFSFYVNCHTAIHSVITPWMVLKPPFEMTKREENVLNDVIDWVAKNTEYDAYKGEPINAGGLAMDWCYKEFRIPSFTFEICTVEYDPMIGEGRHNNLVHWMKTTLPFFTYLLVNIDNLRQWKTPDIEPSLPEGVPPETLS